MKDLATEVIIVAYKEDTSRLEHALTDEGFPYRTLRKSYTATESAYSAQIKCLVSHAEAWRQCAENEGWTIVVEADFVPVKRFGETQPPFNPLTTKNAFIYLYSAAPIIYRFDKSGYLIGHSAATVAYMLDAVTARKLLEFYRIDMSCPEPGEYRAWDTYMANWLRRNAGIPTYVSTLQYGEHGGLPNYEHNRHGIRQKHRADILYRELCFRPTYARDSHIDYLKERITARGRGWYRLLAGKTIEKITIIKNPDRFYLLGSAIKRLMHF